MGKYKYERTRRVYKRKKRYPKIKPGADARLKSVFSEIGVPEDKPFQPDPFQIEALSAIQKSDCLVTAPTGAGKTWIAEKTIEMILKKEGKSWYASPLKALSNAIYAHFMDLFGAENVGILTGDRKENPDAPIIVGTTEILRNHLYDAMYHGEDLPTDCVILDEAHFLGDEDRGVVWEEIMIYLPVRIPLLMLSATIGNAVQIAAWLSSIRGKACLVVEEKERPVPLYPLFFHPSGTLYPLTAKFGSDRKTRLHKKVVSFLDSRYLQNLAPPGKLPPMGDIIRVLKKYRLLPAIFFLKSRVDCDNALELCTEESLHNDPARKARLSQRIESIVSQSPYIESHKQRWHLEHLGVGSHHGGQLPVWKLTIETLMKEGLLDAVFATSTVAAGVNFPARTVVILNSDRFNGQEFVPLTATEFHQMTGRCGRRGMDNIGFAVFLPGKFMDLRLIAKLIGSSASSVFSRIKINFSMILNLLLSHSPEQIKELLDKSFAAYLMKRKRNAKRVFMADQQYLWRDFTQHLNFLKEEGYVTPENRLTDDGIWASRLRIDHPLMIAEGFRLGIFPESNPALLAAIIASFVSRRDTDDDNMDKSKVPKELLSCFLNVKRMLRPFGKLMTQRGFEVKSLSLVPAVTIYAWAIGQPWEQVRSITNMPEGDLANLIFRTTDNLRHIKNLDEVFPIIAGTSTTAITLINREPVVSYYAA